MRVRALQAALLAGVALAAPARAQTPACASVGGSDTTDARADVRLYARVRASELRFATAPRASAEVHGCAPADTVRVLERRNLPSPVEPGVTYRDIEVAVEITTRLSVVCGPVLQALLARPDTSGGAGDGAEQLRRLCASHTLDRRRR